MEQKRIGGELSYRGRVYNVKPLSKGTAFTIKFSTKDRNNEGEWHTVFMNVYYNGDAIIQERDDYLVRGNITVDAPFTTRDGHVRPAQMKLFADYVEPLGQVQHRGTVNRTQAPQQKAKPKW